MGRRFLHSEFLGWFFLKGSCCKQDAIVLGFLLESYCVAGLFAFEVDLSEVRLDKLKQLARLTFVICNHEVFFSAESQTLA